MVYSIIDARSFADMPRFYEYCQMAKNARTVPLVRVCSNIRTRGLTQRRLSAETKRIWKPTGRFHLRKQRSSRIPGARPSWFVRSCAWWHVLARIMTSTGNQCEAAIKRRRSFQAGRSRNRENGLLSRCVSFFVYASSCKFCCVAVTDRP